MVQADFLRDKMSLQRPQSRCANACAWKTNSAYKYSFLVAILPIRGRFAREREREKDREKVWKNGREWKREGNVADPFFAFLIIYYSRYTVHTSFSSLLSSIYSFSCYISASMILPAQHLRLSLWSTTRGAFIDTHIHVYTRKLHNI